jgi:DNA-binding response OmpR family regulator
MSTQPASPPRRILLIEDEEAHAAIIERAFERAGTAHLTVASTLAEAAAAMNASAFVLVISDWHLPDGEAYDLFKDNRPLPCGARKSAQCR